LTPNSFLLLKESATSGRLSQFDTARTYGDVFARAQALANEVWDRWTKEYLPLLTTRAKWQSEERNMKEDDLVLVLDDNLKRNEWKMGSVVEVYPDKKGFVRSVMVCQMVEDKKGHKRPLYYVRPVVKLVLLSAADRLPPPTSIKIQPSLAS
jgi:hypothetical protein